MNPPARYDQVLTWLRDNPGATHAEIATGTGLTMARALLCLRHGTREGAVKRARPRVRTSWRYYPGEHL